MDGEAKTISGGRAERSIAIGRGGESQGEGIQQTGGTPGGRLAGINSPAGSLERREGERRPIDKGLSGAYSDGRREGQIRLRGGVNLEAGSLRGLE